MTSQFCCNSIHVIYVDVALLNSSGRAVVISTSDIVVSPVMSAIAVVVLVSYLLPEVVVVAVVVAGVLTVV